MSDRAIYILIGVAITLVCAGGAVWFFKTFEKVEVERDLGMALEARRNPYLGLERYLEVLEIDVETSHRWGSEQDLWSKDVIIVDPSLVTLSSWAPDFLLDWLDEGGHLILLEPEFDHEGNRNDDFLWSLGIYEDDSHPYEPIEAIAVEYDAVGSSQPYLPYLAQADFFAVEDGREELSPIVVSAPWWEGGQGRVTIIFERARVSNRKEIWLDEVGLNDPDAGRLLADVLALQPQWPDEIMLSPERQSQDWMDIVWKRGWPFFVGLILLFLVGLTRGRRFGPSIAEPDRRRRRRAEHVEATGRFLWHRNGSEILIRASRRALLAAIARRRPSIRTLKPAQRYRLMAEELQVSEEEIQHLMASSQPLNRSEGFRELIARLEELRRKL